MRVFIVLLIFFCGFIFSFCNNNGNLQRYTKTLDSTNGALNQKLVELQKTDTVILEKALTKYNNYKQFVKHNINDTVSKKEADALQQFFTSGNNLELFFINRITLIARAKLVNTQLTKLMLDVKEGNIEQQQMQEFMFAEKEQANDVIQKTVVQQQHFQTNLQQFKTALPLVEELIKTNNNGQLPTIVKDSTNL